ncbi:hypothetical protein [Pseudochrobactrum sp. HB0163]|uniref:hypothetical protein n=1 Tax=Pseudochrobactrum sp. HB0163 TaxID=3450708 RepID=UPI003F6DDFA4
MSAQQTSPITALRFALLAVAAVALGACASGASDAVPQEGALRTGTYPSFGRMPRGETAQLTFEQKDQIANNLNAAKAQQGHVAPAGTSRADIEARKRALLAETDATLKAIEAGQ